MEDNAGGVELTSWREESGVVESCRLGANGDIVKPADFGRSLAAVGELGLDWLLLNEAPH